MNLGYTIPTLVASIIGGLIGMLCHIIKKKVRGESFTAIKKYFTKHFGYTVTALGGMLSMVAFLYSPTLGILKCFGIGFGAGWSCDSAFNKDIGQSNK